MAMAKWPCWDLRCILDQVQVQDLQVLDCTDWHSVSTRRAKTLYRLCVSIVHLGHQCMILDMILDGQVLRSR